MNIWKRVTSIGWHGAGRERVGRRGAALALALVCALVMAMSAPDAKALAGGPILLPGLLAGDGLQKTPQGMQDCFDDYYDNIRACQRLWCSQVTFLWLFTWVSCDSTGYSECTAKAEAVFKCCVDPTNCP
jgi:hypothetical protein